MTRLRVSAEVAAALERAVALETSLVAQGLPSPRNLEAALGAEAAIRSAGAVPAAVGVLDGAVQVGLGEEGLRRIAAGAPKASARDLGHLAARGGGGATTVAATLRAARLAGIRFLATGGIGGVHRGNAADVSADLAELARSPVAVFCSGPKLVLDLGRTREALESLSVPVLGYGCDEMPAFYTRRSGLPVDARVDTPREVCDVLRAGWELGTAGVLVCVPPPVELPDAAALVERAAGDVHGGGADVTPRILARVGALSGGESVAVNVRLVVNNARVAGEVAAAWA